MHYPGRQLVHDEKFDRDCEVVFGSLVEADDKLAPFMFELAHGVAHGAAVAPWVTAFAVPGLRPCVVIVESIGGRLILRALIGLENVEQLAA
jgi:hypothetical protein